jgi:hypothetical protein
MPVLKLSKRTVDAAQSDRDTLFWDSLLTGFGLKVTAAGRKVYVCQYRVGAVGAHKPVDIRSGCTAPPGPSTKPAVRQGGCLD